MTESGGKLNVTKAGMAGVDRQHINQVIEEASRSSKFYRNQQQRMAQTEQRIQEMLRKRNALPVPTPVNVVRAVAEALADAQKLARFDRRWIHIDMDCFFAAVAMREDPSLVGKPIGVGGSAMLSTTNYEARKFGCRSAMPGFIAKKLCPDLIIVPSNFELYREISGQVQTILRQYDPNLEAMSLDEASLDITEYLATNPHLSPGAVAAEMRDKIRQTTRLTASAGVACNRMLAKICSDLHKPDGQYELECSQEAVSVFMAALPVRKIPGIGSVTERLLAALGVEHCCDIVQNAHVLYQLFSPISFRFFLEKSLGVGRSVRPSNHERKRKSLSHERTFRECCSRPELVAKCEQLCQHVFQDWQHHQLTPFKTVTLKTKSDQFEVHSRALTTPEAITSHETLARVALDLLEEELASLPPTAKLRLMGVRISQFGDAESAPNSIAQFWERRGSKSKHSCPVCGAAFARLSALNLHLDHTCLAPEGSRDPAPDGDSASIDLNEADSEISAGEGGVGEGDGEGDGDGKGGSEGGVVGEGVGGHGNRKGETRGRRAPGHECPVCLCRVEGAHWQLEQHVQQCLDHSAPQYSAPTVAAPTPQRKRIKGPLDQFLQPGRSKGP